MIKKWLAIGIILLFVGVIIAPTINFNTVKASQEDDLIEVTTQACGITGYKDTTVKFTREQYQDLEQYLVEFRARLNQISTREEAVPIFKEAVVELDRYGLLPKGMSVERAQKLIIGAYQNEMLMKRLSKLCEYKINDSNQMVNYLCLITGEDNGTVFFPFSSLLFTGIGFSLFCLGMTLFLITFIFAIIPLAFFSFIANAFFYLSYYLFPIVIGSSGYSGSFFGPASGWIQSYGLNGQKSINGSFYGNLNRLRLLILWEGLSTLGTLFSFPAIAGFSGIKIYTPSKNTQFYLGFALAIEVGPDPPDW